jgi:hypothetical protein
LHDLSGKVLEETLEEPALLVFWCGRGDHGASIVKVEPLD